MRSTRSMCSSFAAKPANGPTRAAVRALVAYAWPVISEVSAAAHARPATESYGRPERHEHGAEVGVAEAELPEVVAVLRQLLGRVVGPPDQDLLSREDHLDCVLERINIKSIVVEVRQ